MTCEPGHSLHREGLGWRWQVFVCLIAAAAVVSRRPDVLLNPQFWAEEGSALFAQAYNFGGLHSFVIPQAGYLHTFPRLIAAACLLIPIRLAPLLMNVTGLVVQILPVTVLLSARGAPWGSLLIRFVYAALYLALPNSWEVNVNLTCSQFHLTFLTLLVLLSRPPKSAPWKVFDVLATFLTGMTGPFAILLLPISLIFWWVRRYRWTMVIATVFAICASVQAFTLMTYHGPGARVYQGPLGATPQRLVRIVAGQVFAGALLGQNFIGRFGSPLLIGLIAALGSVVLLYVLLKSRLELKLFVSFCFLLLAASLSKPYIEGNEPQWVLLLQAQGCRYWLLPMLASVWSLVWCVAESPAKWVRIASVIALCLMTVGVVRDWFYPPYPDKHFRQYAAQFVAAAPGTAFTIPINPDGWFVRLVKK